VRVAEKEQGGQEVLLSDARRTIVGVGSWRWDPRLLILLPLYYVQHKSLNLAARAGGYANSPPLKDQKLSYMNRVLPTVAYARGLIPIGVNFRKLGDYAQPQAYNGSLYSADQGAKHPEAEGLFFFWKCK